MKAETTFSTVKRCMGPYVLLLVLQILVGVLVFSTFLSGQGYFAYQDIGSDSFNQVTPSLIHMVRSLAHGEFSGWSFEIGLGGVPTLWVLDVFSWLNIIVGTDSILPARIAIYLFKLIIGGFTCLLLLQSMVQRWQVSVIFALTYSFCGFITINGQWDTEATAYAFYPLVLWACICQLRHPLKGKNSEYWKLPMVVAFSLFAGVFPVSLAIFIFLVCVIYTVYTPSASNFKIVLIRVAPLCTIGALIACPIVLPLTLQLLDASRVSGGDSMMAAVWAQGFSPNPSIILSAEFGGLFHKDIFGVGSHYRGYWNYLEGPGFYVGILSLVVISQLWQKRGWNRRLLVVAGLVFAFYLLFPFLRFMAMGFAAPYFRVSTLWISMGLLLLAAHAMNAVWEEGVNLKLLYTGATLCISMLIAVAVGPLGKDIWLPHLYRVIGLLAVAVLILTLIQRKIIRPQYKFSSLLMLVVLDSILIGRPSFVQERDIVTPKTLGYTDGTELALDLIHAQDASFYRVEKTFDSVSLNDALAQNYRGVKSYYLHNRGAVDFFRAMSLIPRSHTVNNYTNWLPNMGGRFMLNSLLGVKYIVASETLWWPGFMPLSNQPGGRLLVYRNALALPLGIVQTQQLTETEFFRAFSGGNGADSRYKDVALINSAVVKAPMPESFKIPMFDLATLVNTRELSTAEWYETPARALQETGLQIEHFSNSHIVGTINPTKPGVLVFSIPFSAGWELHIDGVAHPLTRTNFGFLGCPVFAGAQKIDLKFVLPGLWYGGALAIIGFAVLLAARRAARM